MWLKKLAISRYLIVALMIPAAGDSFSEVKRVADERPLQSK